MARSQRGEESRDEEQHVRIWCRLAHMHWEERELPGDVRADLCGVTQL